MPFKVPANPPAWLVKWFENKKLKPSFDWRDVWKEEHVAAFTVAKAMEMDILTDIHEAVHEMHEKGITFQQFKKQLMPKLAAKGWWGEKEMIDPKTGEKRIVQLGSPHRLRTIYQANKKTARAAEQWQRIQRAKSSHPYLVYRLGTSKVHRREHEKLDGVCLPVDHPFWKTHFTPNGFGCNCWIQQITQYQYEKYQREGIKTKGEPILDDQGKPTGRFTTITIPLKTTAPKLKMVEWKNARTGKIEKLPEGVAPGWNYNVGMVGRLKPVQTKLHESASVFEQLFKPAKRFFKGLLQAIYAIWEFLQ